MATPINILIDGESLLDYFDHVSVKFSEESYCNSIDISIVSKELWTQFDPIINFGLMRLQVKLGSMNYEFLIEERNTTVSLPGVAFTVWGRSAQALLDQPYAKLINDEEEKIHPWQLRDTTAKEIIDYAVTYCCSEYSRSKVQVHWLVEDFIVYKDSFSASQTTPINIISQLAGIIGAELIANDDGSLTVQEYSVAEGVVVQEYNDYDHIVALNDDIVYPIGFNSVVVNGYGSSTKGSASLSAELVEDDLRGWEYGKYRKIRCYYYHPTDMDVLASVLRGSIYAAGSGTEEFTEILVLVWGEGDTEHPNLEGETTILDGDKNVPLAFRTVTYSCRYKDFMLASHLLKTDKPLFGVSSYYFEDHSNTTTISFDFYDKDADSLDQPEVQLDWNEEEDDTNATVVARDTSFGRNPSYLNIKTYTRDYVGPDRIGTQDFAPSIYMVNDDGTFGHKTTTTKVKKAPVTLQFRLWGAYRELINKVFDSLYNRVTPSFTATILKDMEEEVGFFRGEGNLSRPYHSDGAISWLTPGGGKYTFRAGMTAVKTVYDEDKPFAIGKITYKANYCLGHVTIPISYAAKDFFVYAEKNALTDADGKLLEPEYISISTTIENEELIEVKTIAIVVKDFATDVIIAGASVYVDGVYRGNTDSTGTITLENVTIGDHAIKIAAYGYLTSDEDELANDTFTVS